MIVVEKLKEFYLPNHTHFFTTETRIFEEKPDGCIEFKCEINDCKLHCKLGALTNLNHHLRIHEDSRNWYFKYQKHKEIKIQIYLLKAN
jgi:hypothetical protein